MPPSTDPYHVLRLPKDFTLEQLKTNYKRLALQLHPDKNLVSTEQAAEIFKILTESYKFLLQDYQHRQAHRPFHELRTESRGDNSRFASGSSQPSQSSQQSQQSQSSSGRSSTQPQPQPQTQTSTSSRKPVLFKTGAGHFDAGRFNQFFSENRLTDPVHDTGYGDWLKSNQKAPPAKKEKKKAVPAECRTLMLHVDAMPLNRSKLTYCEMGLDEVDDFSVVLQRLEATDIRVAYTQDEEPKPDAGDRKDYKSIGELERDRASIRFEMSDHDARAYETYQEWTKKHETMEQSQIRARDDMTSSHYRRVQNLLA